MGLQNAMMNATSNWRRTFRVILRFIYLLSFLILNTIHSWMPIKLPFITKFLQNKNGHHKHSGIPQPKRFNSWTDVKAFHQALSLLWVNDLSAHLNNDEQFNRSYGNFQYDSIVKGFFPTKNSALEAVNIERTWKNSFWNPVNEAKPKKVQIYRQSDILFADMMTNTQGIYKVKRVLKEKDVYYQKAKLFFQDLLEKYRHIFCDVEEGKTVLESLICNKNLYYLDYPELRTMENQRSSQQQKYYNQMTTINGNRTDAFIEIPFAIFAKVQNFVREDTQDFLCLAAVFNETFYKKNKEDIDEQEIFHGLSNDIIERDRWEIAKAHMASTDTNQFTFRIHLGLLHYASSIYTTAFCNLGTDKKMPWLRKQFIDIFSNGLLQIDFLANLTLIDHKQPMAQKIFYMTREQTVRTINQSNKKFNILQFDPDHLGDNSFESDAIKMSRAYYNKIQMYIQYLLFKHRASWVNQLPEIYQYLLNQLGDKSTRLDGIPEKISTDNTEASLCKIMTNLAYLWVLHHGETFSLVSVCSNFYFVSPMLRKPLKSLNGIQEEMTDIQKQEFMPLPDIIKDSMTLHKVVTYRADKDCVISRWNDLPIDDRSWSQFMFANHQHLQISKSHYLDFWNDVTLDHVKMNAERTEKGLYYLHWLMPNELPISLNI